MAVQKIPIFIRFNSRCKVCSSALRDEIHRLRLEGKTLQTIADFCKEKGEDINTSNLSTHFKFHFVISEVKKTAIFEQIQRKLLPTLAITTSVDVDELLEKDIDFKISLKTLVFRKIKDLSLLDEKIEDIENGKDNQELSDEIDLRKLRLKTEEDLVSLLEKLEIIKNEYKDLGVLRDFVMKLVSLINDLEKESSEKELVIEFRKKVASLVKEIENG